MCLFAIDYCCRLITDNLGGTTMEDYKLGAIESRFADIIWDNEPMTTKQLVDLCAEELNWKRTTTYTVLKKANKIKIMITSSNRAEGSVKVSDHLGEREASKYGAILTVDNLTFSYK